MKRLLLLLGLLAAALLAWRMGLGDILTLDALKARQAEFQALYAAKPAMVLAAFFALYVAVTGLSLPGAAILTLAAGALFGLVTGTILVSFASTLGATLAFLAARFLFRGPVEARFGDRLGALNRGLEKDGPFYLFTLRLVPIFPFFLINLLMGLTRIRATTFAWVSQIGMLAGTIVYVNAGTELAKIDGLSGILSPGLLLSFVALGLFPWIAKALVGWLARRRVQSRWTRPKRYDRNLIVIGGGAAGLVTAYIAAAVKAKVTLVESHAMGGDCLNTGCVPSKALLASAKRAAEIRSAQKLGIASHAPQVDFPAVMARVRSVIATIEPHDSVERYQTLGVDARIGHATLIDPWTVEIRTAEGTERLTTRAIALATGAKPIIPPIPGLAGAPHLTSETLWDAMAKLPAPPPRLTVLGGGPIGCELAQAFQRLGSQVTLVEAAPRLLAREEPEAAAIIAEALAADGVDLRLGHTASEVLKQGDGRATRLTGPSGDIVIPHDALLVAVGRTARTEGFGLEALGIPAGRTIETNDWLETLHPNIYAVGDAAGPYQLTHAASHQAWHAAVNALFGTFRRFRVDYSVMPAATYTDPEVARVGLTVAEAAAKGLSVDVTSLPMSRFDRALAEGATQGFVQLITEKGKDRILGATIVGHNAGELIAPITLAMRHKLGLKKYMGTIHAYPTLAEGAKLTAGEWRRKTAPQGVLKWVERYHDWRRN
jgi:pyruvate/2-oxoglutarate dehydrogenase complex dihydrolipoamide dehydrogenase (E3) component/uncharacterized membrane protein YdjX (TVP38/TMEM64 family)